ncbi:MAG: TonB-dependent receptor [Tannerella sp.]|nr:TonB-dependent receptor [Tannerella sp.]
MKRIIIFLCLFIWTTSLFSALEAQERSYTLNGYIRDGGTGEDLIGASISADNSRRGTVTNVYGYYTLSLSKGTHTLTVSYLGYRSKEITVELTADTRLNIDLETDTKELAEVVVSAESHNANVSKAEMSVEKLSAKTIKSAPALLGEVDVLKVIQLLPGVQSTSEGSSGFSVRGGGYDQNLILLDEAAVYSASHLMGFFSVFNNDAIKDVTLYKGDIPASFGGRLSSLLDIRTKDGNSQRYAVTGGVGLISSRITAEGPLGDKASAIVSGRRTYADVFLQFSGEEAQRNSTLYFYDMNAKVNYRVDDNNRIFLAGYFGRDRFAFSELAGMDFGNKTLTARWNHIFSPKLFSNFTLLSSWYDYYLKSEISDQLGQELKSGLRDYGFKADFNLVPNTVHNLKFGYNFTFHSFDPGEGGGVGEESIFGRISFPEQYALENVVYVSNETNLNDKLKLKYGLRYTGFGNLHKGKIVHHQQQLEPRAGLTYIFNDFNSVKASYSRTAQFIQLASNSTSGSPLDFWFPASENVKPQKCDQFAAGYFRNFASDTYELSAEIYYKNLKDVVDFRDHAQLMLNENLEEELRFGRGYSYGLELMLRKTSGAFNGWISYTLSKSMRKIESINNGNWYRSPYDKPHNISTLASYEFSPRWTFSASWVYGSGTPVTYPTGRFQVENSYVPIYSGRNEYRYPAYHRLDLSATWKLSPPDRRFRHELNFSLYNAYGRKNAWTILFRPEEDNPDDLYAEKVYLFTFVPSITWNFSF